MKCFVDGNQLCIIGDDFIDLQESNAVFIPISKKDISRVRKLKRSK